VISSQHVFLERERSLEALLVQGPGTRPQALKDELTALKGMEAVTLAITAALLPPLHHDPGAESLTIGLDLKRDP
jgi:CopG family nickel-responsive transcriptional regulator